MKRPLVALLVAPDYRMRYRILIGDTNISIREGFRDYQVGDTLVLCCHLEPWCIMATIAEVRYAKLRDVAPAEYRDAGFSSPDDLLAGMQKSYPNMTFESEVTIIRWDNVRGKLVDDYLKNIDYSVS